MLMMLTWGLECIIIKKNKETLAVASMETGIEVNIDKTKYTVMSQDQNAVHGPTV
jgi:hypothetical protein